APFVQLVRIPPVHSIAQLTQLLPFIFCSLDALTPPVLRLCSRLRRHLRHVRAGFGTRARRPGRRATALNSRNDGLLILELLDLQGEQDRIFAPGPRHPAAPIERIELGGFIERFVAVRAATDCLRKLKLAIPSNTVPTRYPP